MQDDEPLRYTVTGGGEEKMDFPTGVTDTATAHLHFHEQDSNFKFS